MRIVLHTSFILCSCLWGLWPGMAGEVGKEDLSKCPLPNGVVLLPEHGSPKAASQGGYIFTFTDQKLHLDPFTVENKRPASVQDFYGTIRQKQTGDICYSSINKGSLTAFSGRAKDLGDGFLWELGSRRLSRPEEVESKLERSGSGEGYPGVIEGLIEGHRYLVETVDRKYALLRLIGQEDRVGVFQWVYQPNGSREFPIPKGEILAPKPATVQPSEQRNRTAEIQWVYQPSGQRVFQIPRSQGLSGINERRTETEIPAGQAEADDLSDCPLPHRTVVMPEEGSPESIEQKGHIFKFADQKCHPEPWSEERDKPRSAQDLLRVLKGNHTGDVLFRGGSGGGFLALSGRISYLGVAHLWEIGNRELQRPEIGHWFEEDGERLPGLVSPVHVGGCYLVETIDARMALLRVFALDQRSATVQCIYQPDGSRRFTIPKKESLSSSDSAQPEAAREDLSRCPLPHGDAVLPVPGTDRARRDMGYMLRFVDQRLVGEVPGEAQAQQQFVWSIFQEATHRKSGDILYGNVKSGFLVAPSGRIVDLGKHSLHDFDNIRPDRPTASHLTLDDETVPGAVRVANGHCYLLETVTGTLAIVRMLYHDAQAALVQWVCQSERGQELSIPRGKEKAKEPPDVWDSERFEKMRKVAEEHLAQRDTVIDPFLAVLRNKPNDQDPRIVLLCIFTLGRLRCAEAADALLGHIAVAGDYRQRLVEVDRAGDPPLPAVEALVNIGKPAVMSILRRLRDPVKVTALLENPDGRVLALYVRVLKDVEGTDAAAFLLRSEMEKVEEERREVYRKALELMKK